MKKETSIYKLRFIPIPFSLFAKADLSALQLKVLCFIYAYTGDKFFFGNEKLAEMFGVTPMSISRTIAKLEANKYIKSETHPTENGGMIRYVTRLYDWDKSDYTTKASRVGTPTIPSRIEKVNNIKDNTTSEETPPTPVGEETKLEAPAKRLLEKAYSKMEWLTSLVQDDITYFKEKFPNLPDSLIRKEADKAYWWLRDKQVVKKDYRGFLRNWLEKTAQSWGNKNEQERRVRDI